MTAYFRPCGDLTKAPTPRSTDDRDLYLELSQLTGLVIEVDPSVDYEDWMEPACMLREALELRLEVMILPPLQLRRAVMNPIALIPGVSCRDILIGRQLKSDPMEFQYFDLGWPAAGEQKANHYAELETFFARSGRRMQLADMPGDRASAGDRKAVFGRGTSAKTLGAAMADLAPGPVMIKQVYPGKSLPLLSYTLEEGFEASDGERMFFDDVGFHFARYEGDPAALLVQERVTMTHETRFFVIGGKVISGAACIEHHTPQQTPYHDDVLPPVWEIARNSGQMDERDLGSRKSTAREMWSFAWDVAAQIAAEAPDLTAYTLDVALGADDRPLVIELNPAAMSGIYANNATKLMHAIHDLAEQTPVRGYEEWDRAAYVSPGEGADSTAFSSLAAVASTSIPCRDEDGNLDEDLRAFMDDEEFVDFDD
jgi:hypothetical protein